MENRNKLKLWLKRGVLFFLGLFLLGILWILGVNFYVVISTKSSILTMEEVSAISDIDAILVLGCQVRSDGSPSAMLEDRLKTGILLYQNGVTDKIVMSGDHNGYYNEVRVMKNYAIETGVPSSDIFLDHAGFSTYDSVYRAKEIFNMKRVVIVTQSYHLYRALYIAKSLGLEAYGVSSDTVMYRGQMKREVREVLARNKDFVLSFFHVKPTYLGEEIPLSSDGDFTNSGYSFSA